MVVDQLTLPEGDYTLSLEATDPTNKSDVSTVDFTITAPNTIPLCEITEPTNGDFSVAGESVTFVGTFSDPDIEAT